MVCLTAGLACREGAQGRGDVRPDCEVRLAFENLQHLQIFDGRDLACFGQGEDVVLEAESVPWRKLLRFDSVLEELEQLVVVLGVESTIRRTLNG
jgi:hypothetical protein